MDSAFDNQKISYALENFGDFIRGSGSGAIPEWSDAASKVIIDSLRAFQEKLRSHGRSQDECAYELDAAMYAARASILRHQRQE